MNDLFWNDMHWKYGIKLIRKYMHDCRLNERGNLLSEGKKKINIEFGMCTWLSPRLVYAGVFIFGHKFW